MKLFTRFALPLLLVFGFVAVVTFITNYTAAPGGGITDRGSVKSPGANTPEPMRLLELEAVQAAEAELGLSDGRDFFFENPNTAPVTLHLPRGSCTCSHVEVRTYPVAAYRTWRAAWESVNGTAAFGPSNAGVVAAAAAAWARLQALGTPAAKLEPSKGEVKVPAAASPGEPVVGSVRMVWTQKAVGPKMLSATLSAALPGGEARYYTMQVPTLTVSPMGVTPAEPQAFEMRPGGRKELSWVFFSTTRDELAQPAVTVEPNDDCVTLPPPRRLSPDECAAVPLGPDAPGRVRSAWRVSAVIEDGKGGKSLDLGPFLRTIRVRCGDRAEAAGSVEGLVRGDIYLSPESLRERIELGVFAADAGTRRVVQLRSRRPGTELALDASAMPSYLRAKLVPQSPLDGLPRWQLTVEVPEGSFSGDLPRETYVTVAIRDNPPRRINIPVRGRAGSR